MGRRVVQVRTGRGRALPLSARLGFRAARVGCLLHAGGSHPAANGLRRILANRLMAELSHVATEDWIWFEEVLAYDNARLPQALIRTGLATQTPAYTEAGLRSLRWLTNLQTTSLGHFRPVGTMSFGVKNRKPQAFDQQPVEAAAVIAACAAAWQADGRSEWLDEAMRAFAWFLGENDLRTSLITATGGCLDGLHPDRPNENTGCQLDALLSSRPFRHASAHAHGDGQEPQAVRSRVDAKRRWATDLQHSQVTSLSQSQFLNWQALYLRPDPARVVVRPFKPATEPRDLNPTDKTRANHIVSRVLALDADSAAQQLSDVLENFEGRHRNLLNSSRRAPPRWKRRWAARRIEYDATPADRRLLPARILVRSLGFVQPEYRAPSRSIGCTGERMPVRSQSSGGRRRAYFIADVSGRHHRRGRKCIGRPDRAAGDHSENHKKEHWGRMATPLKCLSIGRGTERTDRSFRSPTPVERHRGRALR